MFELSKPCPRSVFAQLACSIFLGGREVRLLGEGPSAREMVRREEMSRLPASTFPRPRSAIRTEGDLCGRSFSHRTLVRLLLVHSPRPSFLSPSTLVEEEACCVWRVSPLPSLSGLRSIHCREIKSSRGQRKKWQWRSLSEHSEGGCRDGGRGFSTKRKEEKGEKGSADKSRRGRCRVAELLAAVADRRTSRRAVHHSTQDAFTKQGPLTATHHELQACPSERRRRSRPPSRTSILVQASPWEQISVRTVGNSTSSGRAQRAEAEGRL